MNDIVLGIPSFNEQDSISHVVKQIDRSLKVNFKNKKAMIICVDGGSTDKTASVFLSTRTKTEKLVVQTAPEKKGKGNGLKKFFDYASEAQAAAINDADLKSINPKWVKLQLDAILKKKYDYATPYYSRYKYDGTITNNICYPLIKSVFGYDIRQPIGGDFAFSGKLAQYWKKAFWPVNARLFGIDIFMTTNAVLGNFRLCQLNLGAKIHRAKDPALTLEPMFRQVVSTLFKLIIENKNFLKKVKKIRKTPILGAKIKKKPKPIKVNLQKMQERFINGFKQHYRSMKQSLSKEDYHSIKMMAHSGKIYVPAEFWAKLVFDHIIAYKKNEKNSSTVLRSFVPLWFARTYTFVKETEDMPNDKAEKLIEKQADDFFRQRDYLIRSI